MLRWFVGTSSTAAVRTMKAGCVRGFCFLPATGQLLARVQQSRCRPVVLVTAQRWTSGFRTGMQKKPKPAPSTSTKGKKGMKSTIAPAAPAALKPPKRARARATAKSTPSTRAKPKQPRRKPSGHRLQAIKYNKRVSAIAKLYKEQRVFSNTAAAPSKRRLK